MTTGSTILQTIVAEFSDLGDAERITRVVVRLSVAAALAGALGYEREQKGKAAGLRTHMLVGLGASLFVLVPQQAGASAGDMTRVLQGVVAGIGFLGAGAILKDQQGHEIQGLTTASSIWLTAAIGVTTGMGFEATATVSTLLALVILGLFGHFSRPPTAGA